MSLVNNLSVQIDVDMSEFNESIDSMGSRLGQLKSSISAVRKEISDAYSSYAVIRSMVQSLRSSNRDTDESKDFKGSDSRAFTISEGTSESSASSLNLFDSKALSNLGIVDKSIEEIARDEATKIIKNEAALLSL